MSCKREFCRCDALVVIMTLRAGIMSLILICRIDDVLIVPWIPMMHFWVGTNDFSFTKWVLEV
jgi:hypothetical protein